MASQEFKQLLESIITESTNITNHEKSVPVLGDNMFERMQVPFKGYSDHLLLILQKIKPWKEAGYF